MEEFIPFSPPFAKVCPRVTKTDSWGVVTCIHYQQNDRNMTYAAIPPRLLHGIERYSLSLSPFLLPYLPPLIWQVMLPATLTYQSDRGQAG